ncbi:MAG TPA: hypothetical protein VI756_12455 [Blastocatellia bacterium]
MAESSQATVSRAQVQARILSSHHFASMVILGVALSTIAYLAAGLAVLNARGTDHEPPQLRIPFYTVALFLGIGSVILRRTQLRWLKLETVSGYGGLDGLLKYLVNTTMLLAGIAELIGLLGLVLCFVGGGLRDVVTLGMIALVLAISSYPKRSAWEKTIAYLQPDTSE